MMTINGDIAASTEAILRARISRAPDHGVENVALRRLAEDMAVRPATVLQTLCEQVMIVCGAESAGVSLLESQDSADFTWPAITGRWAPYTGGGMPRSASPCGVVLQQNRSLIFHDVEQQFPAAAAAVPRIAEILLAPFRIGGQPIGTVWAIVHSDVKRFDREDQRLLESLATFAAAAYQMASASKAASTAEAQLKLANHELAHRLKNMLTMVMAIASQTLKGVTERDAVSAFQHRLQALGTAHDILLDQTWVAAPVELITRRVLEAFGGDGRITFGGPDVTLGPRSALSLSLILHELGTNALKYGALSSTEGRVSFHWAVSDSDDPQLTAVWREENGPTVTTPTRKGFGSRLIGMGLIGSGGAKLAYLPDGVTAEFSASLRLAQDQGR